MGGVPGPQGAAYFPVAPRLAVQAPGRGRIRSPLRLSDRAAKLGIEIYYSPDENLEKEDVTVVATAARAESMRRFTAQRITLFVTRLADAAKHGVKVRVYRDHEQYQEESSRARGRQTCTGELVAAGAAVKVKGTAELMHLKSYAVDGKVLRSGSANLSESGEKRQDNDVIFLGSSAAVNGFERDFESMWDREDNEAVGPR